MSAIFGELLRFPQANGPEVELRAFGDEHYARYENVEGFTAIYDDSLDRYCYANLAGNRFVSTAVLIELPPPPGIVRHLQESAAVKRAKSEERHFLHRSPNGVNFERIVRTFGPNQGLLDGRQLSIGAVRGLTILVNFNDIASSTTAVDVDQMLNSDGYTSNGNICSVREYFLRVSSGKLDYTNVVVGPFTLSMDRQHYIGNLLVEEALQLAVASGLDLKQFDSRDEGIIDALNILYAGQSVYQGELWPHNSFIELEFGSMRTNFYLLTGLGRNSTELSIGTFCHENGHLLCRFPDMYDYGKRDNDALDSAGIGYYCLMGAGNHLDNGRSPAPVCSYLRDLAGWCTSLIDLNLPGDYEANHGSYDVVMKYRTSKAGEYFIVENRTRIGLDRALPSSGLAVYHCDIYGSNELQQGTPTNHYQCSLLQADGRRDLEENANQGDGADLFGSVSGIALSSTSRPNTREWDGRDSGFILSNILGTGEGITLRSGQSLESQLATGEQIPNLAIPDNLPAGVSSTINISASGIVRRVKASVNIKHPYVGDLRVELISPTGRRAVLHDRLGGPNDNISISYDSIRPGELSNLVGLPMQGSWILRVADHAADDVGILYKWQIELESASV